MDVRIHDGKTFMNQYVAGHLPEMEASGGLNSIATPDYNCHRGSFTPDFLVVNQWPSYDVFYKWYRSSKYFTENRTIVCIVDSLIYQKMEL